MELRESIPLDHRLLTGIGARGLANSRPNQHKLLPKLGVVTRAVDSKDLLSMISFEGQVSSGPLTSSFFIGMAGRKPCFSPACCITSLQQKKLAWQLTLRKPTRTRRSPIYPDKLSVEQLWVLSLQCSFALSTLVLSQLR